MQRLIYLSALLALAGCKDEGGGVFVTTDSEVVVDAAPDAEADATPEDAATEDAAPEAAVDAGEDSGADTGMGGADGGGGGSLGEPVYTLTVLHANDAQSRLLGEDIGGAARFVTRMRGLQEATPSGETAGRITVSSGDNFLAGPVFAASLLKGAPYYDSLALSRAGFDAITLGNHDFDFGPGVLANFIGGFDPPVPFLSANLDFSGEPALQGLVDDGLIAPHVVVETGNESIGIIGLITDTLAERSSPGRVTLTDAQEALQASITALEADAIDKIILVSHLDDLEDELALVAATEGIDVLVAGSSDDLWANEGDTLLPDDEAVDAYPVMTTDGAGGRVRVVTTPGRYNYIGRLELRFDSLGRVVSHSGSMVRVVGGERADAVEPDAQTDTDAIVPVEQALAELEQEQIGFSEVPLHGRRRDLRRRETNLGDLVADALLWQANDFVFGTELPPPDLALMNGGAIRNNSIIPPGVINELITFEILPFASFVSIVPEVSREELKRLLENAVSQVEDGSGRFAQLSGLSITWDPAGVAQVIDARSHELTTEGSRILRAALEDGTVLIEEGAVVEGDALTIATIDFLARGGDQYPFPSVGQSTGISYQRALRNFVAGALEGEIAAEAYPTAGVGRITELQETP